MTKSSIDNAIRVSLMESLHGVEKQLNMDRRDILLILLELDTEEKILLFAKWMLTKMEDEEILATPREIIRAACDISDRLDMNADSAINTGTHRQKNIEI